MSITLSNKILDSKDLQVQSNSFGLSEPCISAEFFYL